MITTQYVPPRYGTTPSAAHGSNTYSSTIEQLDRESFIAACMLSERNALTIDLSSRRQIEALADRMEFFNPKLVASVNFWVHSANKEHARDCLTIGGETASVRMWREGKTFMDVVCDAQRALDHGNNMVVRVSPGVAEAHGEELSKQQSVPASRMGPIGRFANMASGGAYGRRLMDKEMRLREALFRESSHAEAMEAHNRQVLVAEQIVKDDTAVLEQMDKARSFLENHYQSISEQVEKDNAVSAARNESIRAVSERIAGLEQEQREVDGYLEAKAQIELVSQKLLAETEEFSDLDALQKTLPSRVSSDMAGQVGKAFLKAGNAIGYRDAFEKISGMAQEQAVDFSGFAPGSLEERCVKEIAQLGTREACQVRAGELKENSRTQTAAALETFKAALSSTGLEKLADREAEALRRGKIDQAKVQRAELIAGQDVPVSGVGAHGAVEKIEVTERARLLRSIEREDMEGILREFNRDCEMVRAGVRQSEKQLADLQRSGPSPEEAAILSNAPGLSMAGAYTRTLVEAAKGKSPLLSSLTDDKSWNDLLETRIQLRQAQEEYERFGHFSEDGHGVSGEKGFGSGKRLADARTAYAVSERESREERWRQITDKVADHVARQSQMSVPGRERIDLKALSREAGEPDLRASLLTPPVYRQRVSEQEKSGL